ncbi:MAG: DNA mismatch repair endonuclease MutL [Clostridiales bacterium]|nr:DNA mismatch repair endonuclease MutL [Clostridiales bacterium]
MSSSENSIIKVLPSDVADKIAAGEVAERPASVVKELVENSIDAGADKITVEIQNGGVKLIRVADNGKGIPPEQVPTAFLRHATSKLRDADDLFKINTMGFRGEALASICAVAKVDIITKTAQNEVGIHYTVDHGICGEPDEIACADGTIMVVEDLFANVPARMKFLKRDSTEAGYVSDLMTRLALSKPEIAFDYICDGKQIFNTSGDGDIKNVILKVYGLKFAKSVIPVGYTEEGVHISGVVGKPELSFGNRTKQTLFVNGRYIKNHVVSKVAEEAFRNSIMVGKFPFFVLEINLPPELVDVNVHPAKTEVKFANEKALYDIVYHAIKNAFYGEINNSEALNQKNISQTEPKQELSPVSDLSPAEVNTSQKLKQTNTGHDFKYSVENSNEFSSARLHDVSSGLTPEIINNFLNYTTPKTDISKAVKEAAAADNKSVDIYNIIDDDKKAGDEKNINAADAKEDTLGQINFTKDGSITDGEVFGDGRDGSALLTDYRIIGQLFDTYVLACQQDKLYMIDQHAAHERARFEDLKRSYFEGERMSQVLLAPVVVSLSHIEYDALMSNLKEFERFGFKIEEFGKNAVLVNETPIIGSDDEIRDLLLEIVDAYVDNIRHPVADFEEKALDMISCKYAIKANDKLSMSEMAEVINQVNELYSKGIKTCPHGRPIVVEQTKYEIEKMFKRIV